MKNLKTYLAIILQDIFSFLFLLTLIYSLVNQIFWEAAIWFGTFFLKTSVWDSLLPAIFFKPLLPYPVIPTNVNVLTVNSFFLVLSFLPLALLMGLSRDFGNKYLHRIVENDRISTYSFLVVFTRLVVILFFIVVTFLLLPYAPTSLLHHYLWTGLFWFNYVVIITSPIWSVWTANSLTRLLKLNKVTVIDYHGGIKLWARE